MDKGALWKGLQWLQSQKAFRDAFWAAKMDVAHGFVSQSDNDSKTFVALHPVDRSPGQSPDLNPWVNLWDSPILNCLYISIFLQHQCDFIISLAIKCIFYIICVGTWVCFLYTDLQNQEIADSESTFVHFCVYLLVGERIASLQPCLKPGSTPMMTQPLTGHTNRRWRRLRTNMAIDSFSAVLVSLVLKRENAR